ncbi:MAG: SDR family NAD(P)-dependent oxidoreductase [Bacteroidota bacterium]
MSKSVAIAGLGWLGLPLAQRLMTLGYKVRGSVTKLEKATILQKNGFDVSPVTLSEWGVQGSIRAFLKEVDDLIVMIPPGLRRNTGSDYVMKMSHFLTEVEAARVKNLIFVSSTSVYGDNQGIVTEKDLPHPENEAGRQLFQVEQLFFTSACNTSIVRFGGLFGGSRQPARYLAGRENLSGGKAPVNLIHRDDCINILIEIIKQQAYGHIFNAVNPEHPMKSSYYIRKSGELGLQPPEFSVSKANERFKQVDSVNVEEILGYSFSQPL